MLDSEIYYRITGGLGNQLFGISESFILHKLTGKHVVVDFAHADHVFPGQKNPFHINEPWISSMVFQPANTTTDVILRNLNKDKILQDDKFFTGWRPNLKIIRQSGYFKRHTTPHFWQYKHDIVEDPYVSLHLRFGDYRHAASLGGDITVNQLYLRDALKIVVSEVGIRFIKVFSDDIKLSKKFCLPFRNLEFEFVENQNSVQDLISISRSQAIVASASTFSFWAAFFSSAQIVIFPKPFFPINPNWEKSLLDESWTRLERRRISRSSIFLRRKFVF